MTHSEDEHEVDVVANKGKCDNTLTHCRDNCVATNVRLKLTRLFFTLAREQHIIQLTQKLITSITTGDFETYRYF